MSDEREVRWRDWMVAAQGGDAPSYEKLLRELTLYLQQFVSRRLFDAASTEDVVQNILIKVHRARHTFRPERPFGPWIHAVARNAIIDFARQRTRRNAREISMEADGVPEPSVEAIEPESSGLSPELAAGLAALPDKQREAVELIHVLGLTVAEAATRAQVSQSALKVRAHRGYKAMRVYLEKLQDDEVRL